MLDKLAKNGLSFSIIVGTLLVPLTALAAFWMTDPARGTEQDSGVPTVRIVTTSATMPITAGADDLAADLQTACGPEGVQLVTLEATAAITDVQRAALDALREVCAQQGIPLPEKPVSDPIVETVIVPAAAGPGPAPGVLATTFDDRGHDDDDGEDRDDYDDDDGEDRDDYDDGEDRDDYDDGEDRDDYDDDRDDDGEDRDDDDEGDD